jgi:hypothetical protein
MHRENHGLALAGESDPLQPVAPLRNPLNRYDVGALALVLSESTDSTSLPFDVVLRSTPPNLAN